MYQSKCKDRFLIEKKHENDKLFTSSESANKYSPVFMQIKKIAIL